MIHSMTAFARRDLSTEWGDLSWELRSVNHRYLEISRKLPDSFRALEPQLRERVSARLNRGKVDCSLSFQPLAAGSDSLELDEDLLRRLTELAHRVEVLAHNPTGMNTTDLLRWPGVVRSTGVDEEALQARALELLDQALGDLVAARRREGERLADIMGQRLAGMEEIVAQLRGILPELLPAFRERLQDRLAEIREQVDPARLEQEVVIFAQKIDVSEEVDRLAAHVEEVRRLIGRPGPVGRRLDFLMQELNREANTLGSKASDMRLTNASVELKVLIEQVREQVQNVE